MPRPLREWQDEIAAAMLEDLARESGEDILDILASEVEAPLSNFQVFEIFEEETDSEELDLQRDAPVFQKLGIREARQDRDVADYLDDYVEERDIGDEEDAYGDEAL